MLDIRCDSPGVHWVWSKYSPSTLSIAYIGNGVRAAPNLLWLPYLSGPGMSVVASFSTELGVRFMSPLIVTVERTSRFDSVVSCVDGSGLAREIFTSQAWSVLPCVRPVCFGLYVRFT
jgi:hypothetical protein